MNEELNNLKRELDELKRDNTELKQWRKNMSASYSIPLENDQAFRARFLTAPVIKASAKGNDSEDRAVDEGGVATYNVLKEPDDFLEVTVDNAIYYIPVYTALT